MEYIPFFHDHGERVNQRQRTCVRNLMLFMHFVETVVFMMFVRAGRLGTTVSVPFSLFVFVIEILFRLVFISFPSYFNSSNLFISRFRYKQNGMHIIL